MPTQTSERWIADGEAVQTQLEEAGYTVDLQFAGDDIPTQSQQVDQMITQGADALIIAAIDGTALSGQLQAAADAGIPVISYDRLIRDSENVDFYVSFDNYRVGVAQAEALLTGLGLQTAEGEPGEATGPFNVELFAGSLDDNNATFFWNGAMDTLQPFIDDGTLVVPSGRTTIEQAATLRWQQETAQRRMEDLLTSSYNDGGVVDGVLSPYDGLSRGIITALQNAGYGGADNPMPVITGQDAEIASVTLIADGVQLDNISLSPFPAAYQQTASGFLNGLIGGQGYDAFTLLIFALAVAGYAFTSFRGRLKRISYQQPVESFPLFVVRIVIIGAAVMAFAWQLAHARGLPIVLIILAVLVIVYGLVTTRTVFGRRVYAIGGNLAAAQLSGVNVKATKFWIFVNMGFLAGVAGVIYSSRSNGAQPSAGNMFELDAIAAAFIGGAAVTGGVGTVVGAMIGGLIMAVMSNGMQLMGMDQSVQSVVKGMVLLLAVAFDVWNKRRAGASR